jgi:hypothetical protein
MGEADILENKRGLIGSSGKIQKLNIKACKVVRGT